MFFHPAVQAFLHSGFVAHLFSLLIFNNSSSTQTPMKLLERQKGVVKLIVEEPDDLWYLYMIISQNDHCTGESEYKFNLGSGDTKSQVVKRKVTVTISVEKSEFSRHTGQLRITGKVIGGSEEVPRGSFHSLDITCGSKLSLYKEHWHDYEHEKLEESLQSSGNVLIVLFDREHALFATLRPSGHECLLTIKGDVPKKGVDEGKQHAFYKDIAKHIDTFLERFDPKHIVLASPGFWREYLEKELSQHARSRRIFTTTSTVDESAIKEVLLRPELTQALQSQRAMRELELLEKIMASLAKDRLAYGIADVRNAVHDGNLSEIAVTETLIVKKREEETFEELEALMRSAQNVGARVHLLASEETIRTIDGLGGIVGIKRW